MGCWPSLLAIASPLKAPQAHAPKLIWDMRLIEGANSCLKANAKWMAAWKSPQIRSRLFIKARASCLRKAFQTRSFISPNTKKGAEKVMRCFNTLLLQAMQLIRGYAFNLAYALYYTTLSLHIQDPFCCFFDQIESGLTKAALAGLAF
jgi:hypothetical protein